MEGPVQLIRFTKTNGNTIWINPEQIIFAEQYEKKKDTTTPPVKDPKTAKEAKQAFETIVHVTGKEPKLFIKESPDEINKILRSLKRTRKTEHSFSYQ